MITGPTFINLCTLECSFLTFYTAFLYQLMLDLEHLRCSKPNVSWYNQPQQKSSDDLRKIKQHIFGILCSCK